MKQLSLVQGSPAWHAARAKHFCASEAPAMMGVSPYMTRTELLREKKTGISKDVDPATQRLFDSGHQAEAQARPLAEEVIGQDLFPMVGTSEVEGLPLLASFDGITMDEMELWEHKLMNVDLAESLANGVIPEQYHPQLEHQLLVSGAQKTLFMGTSLDKTAMEHAWYTSNPELRQRLIDGWKQFAKDLETYVPEVIEAKPVGRTPETLPALHIEVTGMVKFSNLAEYKAHALEVFGAINRELKTDEQFADAEKTIKWAAEVETRLEAAKQNALGQTASIDELFRTIDDIAAEARRVRLDLDRLVKARKEQLRAEIVTEGAKALATHLESLNASIGKPYMPAVPADFAGAIKGKRTIASLKDAVSTTLASAKIAANAIADKIHVNLRAINAQSKHPFLFSDSASLVLKEPEYVEMVISKRIAEHQAIEAARIETERQRIANEERAKAEADIAEAKRASEEAIAKAAQQATIVVQPAQPMPPVQFVEQAQVKQPTDTGTTIRLGQICERLGFTVTAEFLFTLGFEPHAVDKNAKLYKESTFPAICRALVQHINAVSQPQPA